MTLEASVDDFAGNWTNSWRFEPITSRPSQTLLNVDCRQGKSTVGGVKVLGYRRDSTRMEGTRSPSESRFVESTLTLVPNLLD